MTARSGEEYAPDVGCLAGVVEGPVQLVHRVRPEGVAHLGPVEGHPHRPLIDRPVVGDVGEGEAATSCQAFGSKIAETMTATLEGREDGGTGSRLRPARPVPRRQTH